MNTITHTIHTWRLITGTIALAAASVAHAQGETPSRRVDPRQRAAGSQVQINEVNTDQFPKIRIFATVTKDGVPLKGLGASDFRVREDEVDQEPLNVEPKLPALSVVITMDTSGSMSKRLKDAQAAAISFLDLLSETDSAQVVSFAREVKRLSGMTTSRSALRDGIMKTVARGDTALYDALYESISLLKDRLGRKAIVLLSDGVDDNGSGGSLSKHTVREVLALARQVNAPIFVVGVGTELDEATLSQVAEETGGMYLKAPQASQLKQLYGQIGEQLAGQYSIRYASNLPADGVDHSLKLSYGDAANVKHFKPSISAPPKVGGPPPPGSDTKFQVKSTESDIPDWVPIYGGISPQRISVFERRGAISGCFGFESREGTIAWYSEKLSAKGYKVTVNSNLAIRGESATPKRVIVVTYLLSGDIDVRFHEEVPAAGEVAGASKSQLDQLPEWVPLYPGAVPTGIKIKPKRTGVAGSYSIAAGAAAVAHVPIDYYADTLAGQGFEIKREHTRVTGMSAGRSVTATNLLNGRVEVTFDEEKQ